MADEFLSPRRCVERAKKHIAELDGQVNAWLKTVSDKIAAESEPQGREHPVDRKSLYPLEEVAFDTINGLRTALDQACFAAAVAGGNPDPKKAQFPFGDDAAGLENVINRGCKHIPPDIVALLRAFKPYPGGNIILWALNKLANTNKHRLLAEVSVNEKINISLVFENGRFFYDPAKKQFTILPGEGKTESKINVIRFIAFRNIDPISGDPAVAVLYRLASEVDGIISAIEAECRRLDFIS